MYSPIAAPALAGNTLGGSGSDFVVAEWQDPGGVHEPPRRIAPLHVHHSDDEAWYVLEGALAIQMGDGLVEARAGSAVLVPRGVPHTYWNPGPERVRYLLVMTPRISGLIAAIHAMAEKTPDKMRELFRNYDSELLE
jgi:mannose-6-phosphate isomerase-like protein (cupin superfamily)